MAMNNPIGKFYKIKPRARCEFEGYRWQEPTPGIEGYMVVFLQLPDEHNDARIATASRYLRPPHGAGGHMVVVTSNLMKNEEVYVCTVYMVPCPKLTKKLKTDSDQDYP